MLFRDVAGAPAHFQPRLPRIGSGSQLGGSQGVICFPINAAGQQNERIRCGSQPVAAAKEEQESCSEKDPGCIGRIGLNPEAQTAACSIAYALARGWACLGAFAHFRCKGVQTRETLMCRTTSCSSQSAPTETSGRDFRGLGGLGCPGSP